MKGFLMPRAEVDQIPRYHLRVECLVELAAVALGMTVEADRPGERFETLIVSRALY